ncbi:4026_t:CDS:2, partial [Racocetra persica]
AGIKEFDFSNNPNLETINIKGNGVEADLSIFSNLPKLRRLEIGINATWSIGTSNNFSGSLASLKNCENLEYLDISYQNEITGNLLEDLIVPMPKLTEFYCAGTEFDELLRPSGYNTNDLRLLYQQSIDKKLQLERERQKEKQNHFKKILLYSFGLFLL